MRPGGDRARGSIHGRQIGLPVGIQERRHDHGDGFRNPNARRRVGRRGEPPLGDTGAQDLLQAVFTANRTFPAVHQLHDRRVDVAAHDGMPERGDSRRQRQSDLPQADDADVHRLAAPVRHEAHHVERYPAVGRLQ